MLLHFYKKYEANKQMITHNTKDAECEPVSTTNYNNIYNRKTMSLKKHLMTY